MATKRQDEREVDENRDPMTGEHGAHPVGAGLGAAAGGIAAGAAAGAVAGPIGAAVGAVVGGVAGGLAGKEVAERIDPTVEDAYWRENYSGRPYYDETLEYDRVAPAYRHGWESRTRYADRSWEEAEADVERDWAATEPKDRLDWDRARHATKDAWHRVEDILPGDADRDGH